MSDDATDPLALVAVAANQADTANEDLHTAIVAAVAAGHSHRQVAAAARITHPTVANIMRAETLGSDAAQR